MHPAQLAFQIDSRQGPLGIGEKDRRAAPGRPSLAPLDGLVEVTGQVSPLADGGDQDRIVRFQLQGVLERWTRTFQVRDLLDLADPRGLTTAEEGVVGLGPRFSFPFVCPESLVILDASTLVLVNGRRVPQFPFGQDGISSFVDINLIPLGLVERVEILKDGASAIYGSDAIAGVVNIILRRDYEGVDVSASYGQSDESDGDERRFTFAGGRTGSRGNVTFGLEYLDRDNVWSKNRDLSSSANGPFDDRSHAGNPGTIIRAAGFPEPDPRCPPDRISAAKGPFCLYDFGPDTTLIPEAQRINLMSSASYDLTHSLSAFASVNYTDSSSKRDLAPASGSFSVSGTNPNTIFPGEDVNVIYRLLELGPRTDDFETDAYNLLAGLTGTFRAWDWELGAGGGKIDTKITGENGYATQTAVQNAVDDGTLNLFGTSPNLDPNAISYETRRDGESKMYFVDFKIGGDILDMKHGALSAAAGAEYRKEEFSDEFDPVTESGDVLGVGGISSDGDRHSESAYLELSVPILSNVEVQLAGRYDH